MCEREREEDNYIYYILYAEVTRNVRRNDRLALINFTLCFRNRIFFFFVSSFTPGVYTYIKPVYIGIYRVTQCLNRGK